MNCNKILNMYAALSKRKTNIRSVKFLESEHDFVCIDFPWREHHRCFSHVLFFTSGGDVWLRGGGGGSVEKYSI